MGKTSGGNPEGRGVSGEERHIRVEDVQVGGSRISTTLQYSQRCCAHLVYDTMIQRHRSGVSASEHCCVIQSFAWQLGSVTKTKSKTILKTV